jgi:hypothetical protein
MPLGDGSYSVDSPAIRNGSGGDAPSNLNVDAFWDNAGYWSSLNQT